jgi:hypothetical protein
MAERKRRAVPQQSVQLPVPTRLYAEGESAAVQSAAMRRVEAGLLMLADRLAAPLGMDRRHFLQSSCGMAAAFLALNAVFGPLFTVVPAEAADPEAAAERAAGLQGTTHLRRPDPFRPCRLPGDRHPRPARAGQTVEPAAAGRADAGRHPLRQLLPRSLPAERDLAGAAEQRPARGPAALVPQQRRGGPGARENQRHSRLETALRPRRLHPRSSGVAGRAGARRRLASRRLEGVHGRQPLRRVEMALAARRREARLPGLRADGQGGDHHSRHPQGAAPLRLPAEDG